MSEETTKQTETAAATPRRVRPSRQTSMIAGIAAIAILSFAAGGFVFAQQDPGFQPGGGTGGARIAAAGDLPLAIPIAAEVADGDTPRLLEQGAPFSFANIVEHVSPAVVTILSSREAQVDIQNPEDIPEPFREFFRRYGEGPNAPPRRSQAMGSGFFIESDGYLVTNNHVIDDADEIKVQLPDGREFDATVVGTDEPTDIALLKVDGATDLPTVAFGDDRRLRVGDWVVAVGNPFGLGGTVTAGIVSSINRDIGGGPYNDFIQIDAPINQGNSGGPTFDLSGRVVGMNSAIFSPSGGSVGIGFAIPASVIQEVVSQLRSGGEVARGWLGVEIQDLTPEMATSIGVPDAKGAIVARVLPDSPALRAGLQAGDVITSVDNTEVNDRRDLTRRVGALLAGQRANFEVLRNGEPMTINALIERRDEEQIAGTTITPGDSGGSAQSSKSLGLGLSSLTPLMRQQFNLDDSVSGVLVTDVLPNSEAAEKGFRAGMIILAVGNDEVMSPEDIETGIAAAREAGRENVLLLVTDGQGQRFVTLSIEEE
jgi:serine protease Do